MTRNETIFLRIFLVANSNVLKTICLRKYLIKKKTIKTIEMLNILNWFKVYLSICMPIEDLEQITCPAVSNSDSHF